MGNIIKDVYEYVKSYVAPTKPDVIYDFGRGEARSPGTTPASVSPAQQVASTKQLTGGLPSPSSWDGGGGSSGGGGESSSAQAQAQAQAQARARARAITQAKAAAKAKAAAEAKRQAEIRATQTQEALRSTTIQSRTGAGISITTPGEGSTYSRTITYHGKADVPGTGMTANQYRREQERLAREKYNIKPGERIRYSSTTTIPEKVVKKKVEEEKEAKFKVDEKGYVKPIVTGSENLFFDTKVDRTGQVYSPDLGAYVKPTYGMGAGGTAIVSPPTPEEKIKIQEANIKGSFGKVTNFLTPPPSEVKAVNIGSKYDIGGWLEKHKQNSSSWLSPEGVKKGFDWAAEQTLKGGEFLAKGLEEVSKFQENVLGIKTGVSSKSSLFTTPSPIKRETAKEIISTAYTFVAFEPFMRTGTYQQSQYADEVVEVMYKGKKVKMSLSEAQSKGLTPLVSREAVVSDLQYYPKKNQINIIKESFKKRVYLDELSFQKDVVQATSFMKESGLSNTRIKEILREVFPERFLQQQTSTILKTTSTGGKTSTTQNLFTGTSGVELKGISAVETTTSLLNPSQDRQMSFVGQSSGQTTNQAIEQKTEQKTKQILWVGQGSGQTTKQKTEQKTKQTSETLTSQLTKQQTKQISILDLRTVQKQIQRPKLETKNIFEQETKPLEETPPEEPTKVIPILSLAGRVLKRVQEKPESFEAFGIRFGKPVSIAKGTKKATAKKLEKFLSGTLGASGFLETGGKKILAGETGLLKKPSFRKSKVSEFLVVERKAKRLRKTGTGKQIQVFRSKGKKSKKSNLFNL